MTNADECEAMLISSSQRGRKADAPIPEAASDGCFQKHQQHKRTKPCKAKRAPAFLSFWVMPPHVFINDLFGAKRNLTKCRLMQTNAVSAD